MDVILDYAGCAACGGNNEANTINKEELKALVQDYSLGSIEGHTALITSEQ